MLRPKLKDVRGLLVKINLFQNRYCFGIPESVYQKELTGEIKGVKRKIIVPFQTME
jgi:hypothetical protein